MAVSISLFVGDHTVDRGNSILPGVLSQIQRSPPAGRSRSCRRVGPYSGHGLSALRSFRRLRASSPAAPPTCSPGAGRCQRSRCRYRLRRQRPHVCPWRSHDCRSAKVGIEQGSWWLPCQIIDGKYNTLRLCPFPTLGCRGVAPRRSRAHTAS